MDFYAILGIAPDADAPAIRAAYRLLARRYHPDAGDGSSSEKFRQVVEAYETLSDPGRRASYDRSHPHTPHAAPPHVPVEPLSPDPRPFTVRRPDRPRYGSPFVEWDLLFDEWLRGLFR